MADIFLSYSHYDRPRAEPIVQALTAAGYSVFWDQSTPSGGDWNALIREELQGARVCVVLWSKSSVDSRNVVHEATIALNADRLVPAMLEPLTAEDFPMGFYTVQAVDLSRGGVGDLNALVAAVHARIGGPAGNFIDLPERAEQIPGSVKIIRSLPRTAARAKTKRSTLGLAMTALAGCVAGYILLAFSSAPTIDTQFSSQALDATFHSALALF